MCCTVLNKCILFEKLLDSIIGIGYNYAYVEEILTLVVFILCAFGLYNMGDEVSRGSFYV